jgi:hypothetical protein
VTNTGPPLLDPETNPLLTVEQVTTIPNMACERSIREAIARGEFPHRRIGRRIVIPTAELRVWLGLDFAASQ